MKKEEKVPLTIFKHQLEINHKLQFKLHWLETFLEYIKKNNIELYKKANKYTNDLEANDYFTEEDKKKWGIK
jgi:hypothetical protein